MIAAVLSRPATAFTLRQWRKVSLFALCLVACSTLHAQDLAAARALARQGKADAAIQQTQAVLKTAPRDAEAHELLCLLLRSTDHFDAAVHECEAARDLQSGSSAFWLELARTYGARADHAGALTGMRLVGRIRDSFERAVALDGANVDALSDLGEFYVQAPGLVGGGLDKARALVLQLRPLSPERAHRLAGMIAAKAGDQGTAAAEFAAELNLTHSPEAYVDQAVYQRKLRNDAAAASNAVLAIQKDTAHGPDTIDAAQVLVDLNRNGDTAEAGLRQYLAHPQVSAVVPAAKVHTLLGKLLLARGDKAGARQQFTQALALAADYPPAEKALGL